MPALVRADAVTADGHVSSGAAATGGGGGGVGPLGVELHAAPPISASNVRKILMFAPVCFFSSSVRIHKFSVVHVDAIDNPDCDDPCTYRE